MREHVFNHFFLFAGPGLVGILLGLCFGVICAALIGQTLRLGLPARLLLGLAPWRFVACALPLWIGVHAWRYVAPGYWDLGAILTGLFVLSCVASCTAAKLVGQVCGAPLPARILSLARTGAVASVTCAMLLGSFSPDPNLGSEFLRAWLYDTADHMTQSLGFFLLLSLATDLALGSLQAVTHFALASRAAKRTGKSSEECPSATSCAHLHSLARTLFSTSGRSSRGSFWLLWFPATMPWFLLSWLLFSTNWDRAVPGELLFEGALLFLCLLPVAWVGVANQARRLHDRDRSAWMVLIHGLPILGSIWALFELGCRRGTEGANRFGADPLRGEDASEQEAAASSAGG